MKNRRMQRRKTNKALPLIAGGILVIIVVTMFYLNLFDFIGNGDEEKTEAKIVELAPLDLSGFVILSELTDLNSDGNTESLYIRENPDIRPSRSLQQDGYNRAINEMWVKQGDKTLLIINKKEMLDSDGKRLLMQVEAAYGYGLRVQDYTDPEHYTGTVQLFHLVILDERGRDVSDEITIYWKPSAGRYAATNTFGAPGTF